MFIEAQLTEIQKKYEFLNNKLRTLYKKIQRDQVELLTGNGVSVSLDMRDIVRVYQPNNMGFGEKLIHYFEKVFEFVSEEPREANTGVESFRQYLGLW